MGFSLGFIQSVFTTLDSCKANNVSSSNQTQFEWFLFSVFFFFYSDSPFQTTHKISAAIHTPHIFIMELLT